ncbi:secretion stress-responsive two-component system sensor histidine kinase CssS [Vallitalea sediminicola]
MFFLRDFFTDEVYNTIEATQMKYTNKNFNKQNYVKLLEETDLMNNIRNVTHIKYPSNIMMQQLKLLNLDSNSSDDFLTEILDEFKNQESQTRRYEKNINGKKLFYVIYKFDNADEELFLLSFMWDTYRNNLVKTLFSRFIIIIIIGIIISLVASLRIAKYLTCPIEKLEIDVRKIAKRDWYNPIISKRKDEIGRLAYSIEDMRKELVKRDDAQQWMLQNISHELKTPVMVIRSYAQSVEDGIYPKGDLNSTMHVIDIEAERLQKRIKDLLYLTKLEYMAKHEKANEKINIKSLIKSVVERFEYANPKLTWDIDLDDDAIILGKKNQMTVVIENLLDNSMRYAKEKVSIILEKNETNILIHLQNDGELMDDKVVSTLFNQFQKGNKGKFGLGLTIVKQIVEFHKGKVWAVNDEDGVSFYLEFPKDI